MKSLKILESVLPELLVLAVLKSPAQLHVLNRTIKRAALIERSRKYRDLFNTVTIGEEQRDPTAAVSASSLRSFDDV